MSGDQIVPVIRQASVDVSFVVACYNAGPYLEPALRSALNQSGVTVEVLVIDDGSTDGSQNVVRRLAETDPRVVLLQTAHNIGPGGARNVGLSQMRGKWYAVLDADDIIEPERSKTLIAVANRHDADMVADNLIQFGADIAETKMFSIAPRAGAHNLTLAEYLQRSRLFGQETGPGYLKPMIRKAAMRRAGLRYNESLRIAEDDELVIRALLANLKYVVCDYAGYRYRRHDASISHRLSLANLEKMVAAEQQIARALPVKVRKSSAYQGRWKALSRGHAFTRSIEALKSRSYLSAILAIARQPAALALYSMPISARIQRLLARPK